MNRNLITIALLAGLMLASSCNLLRPNRGEAYAGDLIADRPVVLPDEGIGGEEYAPYTLIISYDTIVGTTALDRAIETYGAEVKYRYRLINALAITIPEDKDIHDAIRYFSRIEGVLAVNRDRINHLHLSSILNNHD